jgi:hypothetical protein
LDVTVFSTLDQKPGSNQTIVSAESEDSFCPSACTRIIEDNLTPAAPTLSPEPTIQSTSLNTPKEFYIPLGSGKTMSRDFAELVGVEAVINTANYPRIKSVLFEVSMHLFPGNGRMTAKLFNITDRHDVWFSELSTDEGQIVKKETPITLVNGEKLYRVMVQSTLGYEAIVDNARIRIITE